MAERLQKILSAHGVASRRESEKMISAGRVAVNGVTATLGQSAQAHEVTVDGIPLAKTDRLVYIMLNKPKGIVTTMKDERGRKTVAQLIGGLGIRVYPIGRLDMDSEGLLIMTNDGEFANRVAHPSFNKEKTYRVTVSGDVRAAAKTLSQPFEIDGYTTRPARVEIIKETAQGGILLITIHEGRNRQIRKMCAQCGLSVKSLIRISVGGLRLGDLGTGEWRFLTKDEIKILSSGVE